jgi:hypothetical protein
MRIPTGLAIEEFLFAPSWMPLSHNLSMADDDRFHVEVPFLSLPVDYLRIVG